MGAEQTQMKRRRRSDGRTTGYKQPKNAPRSLFDPAIRQARPRGLVQQARSAAGSQEPGHVRRRGRQRHHDRLSAIQESLSIGAAGSSSSGRCRCGSGSRSCSPTSPRRWPKDVARRRPTRCARRRPTPWRAGWSMASEERSPGTQLRKGDLVVCEAGEVIPGDGEVVEGIATRGRIGDHRESRPPSFARAAATAAPSPAARRCCPTGS